MLDQNDERKSTKKKLRKCLCHITIGIILFLLGMFIGIHWKVIFAMIKGEDLPKAPEEHCHHFCRKK